MLLGSSQPPVVLPSLSLALHAELCAPPAAPEPPDNESAGNGDELSDDSMEARAADAQSARRSRGRPRGAKDKQPRVKRAAATAVAAPEGAPEGGVSAAPGVPAEDAGTRGRDAPESAADRRPPRRTRPLEPGQGRGDGGDGGATTGSEGYGRRKPWKIVLSAQDALDIYRSASDPQTPLPLRPHTPVP